MSLTWELLTGLLSLLARFFKASGNAVRKARQEISRRRSSSADGEDEMTATPKGILDVPGPSSVPFFGSLWTSLTCFGPYRGVQYHDANEMKLKQYGPVVRENLINNFPLIHLFDRDDIKRVLYHPSQYPLRPPNEADVYYRRHRREQYLNDGIVNLMGPDWHALRAKLTPPLTNRATLRHYASSMNQIADSFLDLVMRRRCPDTGVVPGFKDLVYLAGLETVSEVALERRMGFLDGEDMSDDTRLILDSIRGYQTSSNQTMYGIPVWKVLPHWFPGCLRDLMVHKDNLYRLIGAVVDEKLKADASDRDFGEENSILNQLVDAGDIDSRDIKASVIDYITAGVETIGNSIIFAMALVASRPEVRAKLQAELDRLTEGGSREIDGAAVQEMRYLRACVTESFRLYPTACQIARILEEDTKVKGGYVLPRGSVVLCQQRIASLQEENFTRAREFIPERWTDEMSDELPKCERSLVCPFGVGKRACPGRRLAEQEIYIIVARLYQRYDVDLLDEFKADFNFLLAPSDELRFKVTERSSAP